MTPPLAIHSCRIRTTLFRIQDRISSTSTHLRDQMHSFCKPDLEQLGQWGVGVNMEQGWLWMAPCSTQEGDPTQDLGCMILSLSALLVTLLCSPRKGWDRHPQMPTFSGKEGERHMARLLH